MTTTTTTFPPLSEANYALRVVFEQPTGAETYQGKAFYRLAAAIVTSSRMDKEVFLHQRKTTNNPANPYIDEFIAVCGPVDLTMVGIDTPDSRGFIRKATVDMLLSTVNHYAQVKEAIVESLQELCDNLTSLSALTQESVVVVDSPAPATTTTTAGP